MPNCIKTSIFPCISSQSGDHARCRRFRRSLLISVISVISAVSFCLCDFGNVARHCGFRRSLPDQCHQHSAVRFWPFRFRRCRTITAILPYPSPLPAIPDWRRLARGASQIIPDWRGLQKRDVNWCRLQDGLHPSACPLSLLPLHSPPGG